MFEDTFTGAYVPDPDSDLDLTALRICHIAQTLGEPEDAVAALYSDYPRLYDALDVHVTALAMHVAEVNRAPCIGWRWIGLAAWCCIVSLMLFAPGMLSGPIWLVVLIGVWAQLSSREA